MSKISGYPTKASPALSDTLLGDDSTGPTTSKFLLSALLAVLGNQSSSTVLSSSIGTYANTGTLGGTFYYINLGGIKLLWGAGAAQTTINGATGPLRLNFPASFFTSIQMASASIQNVVTTSQQYASLTGLTTSSIDLYIISAAAGSATPSLWIIGS